MRPRPPGCRRLSPLGGALGLCLGLALALALLGGPLQGRRHVLFLKTHKTGGSSLVNLLSRYGESRQLRFALPHPGYQFGYPAPFRAERVRGFRPGGAKFDLLCHHTRFHLPEVQRVMPNDTFYFSIVRDPATLGASAFSYFRSAAPAFRLSPSLDAFLASPSRFYRPGARGNHYARNLQWFDFGLPQPVEARRVPELLAGLERTFPLVLLAERFDEGLVLLRERLCWPRGALDTFPHNARGGAGDIATGVRDIADIGTGVRDIGDIRTGVGDARDIRTGVGDARGDIGDIGAGIGDIGTGIGDTGDIGAVGVSAWRAQRLRAWNSLDWALYSHFNRSFWRQAREFGLGRLRREAAELRRRRRELAGLCLRGGGPVPAREIPDRSLRPFQPPGAGAGILGFALKEGLGPEQREMCGRMALPELPYKDLLERRQFGNGSAG